MQRGVRKPSGLGSRALTRESEVASSLKSSIQAFTSEYAYRWFCCFSMYKYLLASEPSASVVIGRV